jgi:hypothetical protein
MMPHLLVYNPRAMELMLQHAVLLISYYRDKDANNIIQLLSLTGAFN